jgi:hypothetical protein
MAVAASSRGGLLVRAPVQRCRELVADGHASFMEMGGRRLNGWVQVPLHSLMELTDLERWVDIGVNYARTLAPKD